jgi:DNA polymerase III subunit delta'
MEPFAALPEQQEAKRLLTAALREGPAHAYLLHGPAGTGKHRAAYAFAGALLGDARRVDQGTHPDLYVLEALGEMIRIDAVRELRRDLHMRPFEADRRVYLILSAHLLNEDAADALLKDLEEPPPYAVIVLVANELGPLPPTIRSRCQLVPFRRLSEPAVRAWLEAEGPGLSPNEVTALARVAAGRLDRARRLLEPDSVESRRRLLEAARGPYADDDFEPAQAADVIVESSKRRAARAKEAAEAELEHVDLTAREAEQRVRRAGRGAEREDLLASLEELALWYRDLTAVGVGAESAVVHADQLEALRADAVPERLAGAERAAELVRETWRAMEEFNVNASLTLEALFIRLRRELGAVGVASSA